MYLYVQVQGVGFVPDNLTYRRVDKVLKNYSRYAIL